jgi:DNA (cytosine-5)-methyltransferase 1
MGLDLGLEGAGFSVRVAVECNKYAVSTIRRNRPTLALIERRIENVPTEEILTEAKLRVGEATVVSGGPSCQPFSTAGQRGALGDPRGAMFQQFLRVVRDARPRFFVMENVRGMLSAAIKHRKLAERGPGFPTLDSSEELGSAFEAILRDLRGLGYFVVFDLVDAADYGAPQHRQRILFMGSRDGERIDIPRPTHGRIPESGLKPWLTLRDALHGLVDSAPEHPRLSPTEQRLLTYVPPGGNWRDIPARLHKQALGAAYESWGGRSGFYRRLSWDEPSPALTTVPDGRATMLCHPAELRPLSVREYARIQQFPDSWTFEGSTSQQYKQIGNAVPLALGRAVGAAVRASMTQKPSLHRLGAVVCPDALRERIAARSRTVLNPTRMRKDGALAAAKAWIKASTNRPRTITSQISAVEDVSGVPAKHNTVALLRAHRVTLALHAAYGSPDHNNKLDPLDELVFIVLSQMTTHHSFERVYDRIKSALPDWGALAGMRMSQLKRLIKDAGLSGQKAPRLKQIMRRLVIDFGEATLTPLYEMSDDDAQAYLTSLPGVGVKTAKCVLMYALGRHVLPVDTHVWRVGKRLGLVDSALTYGAVQQELERAVPPTDRYSFHVNAILLGRDHCTALRRRCEPCPVRRYCPSSDGPDEKLQSYEIEQTAPRQLRSRASADR